ncbi:amino acid permease-associated region [Chthoniobacter flavus Ellin428]|uniref:Amino acid permease-associated region n=1 Tax=Chthoniobacter flavus Ellin428 TaxID=497964 RepID=B4CU69_9BACT|nr:amino acid permease [Chthoniobacter flavus]EDY22107.1 amino acid permease-associated region [Chthoniobacter flavus Ellin428]TCO94859.1 amino acid transporter [Chthoniobacter flavus]
MITADANRPRNVDWKRAAALLYGDWGTSKAYVIGLAFGVAAYSSLPIILAVCLLTGLVGINYLVICRHFPDGGGVYSAARAQGRLLAVVGALLLIADLTVTAALSGYSGLDYFNLPFLHHHIVLSTIGALLIMGWLNSFGPKHSGGLAVLLSVPVVVIVVVLIAVSLPHLTTAHLTPPHESSWQLWKQFTGTILALSGVEAIANMTGVLKLDPGSTPEHPKVGREASKAIWSVAVEVVFGTALLGWAMLSIPRSEIARLEAHKPDMLRFVGEYFGSLTVAPWFGHALGWATGILFFLLLISAANTAIIAMIGVFYMMARDGEMPRQFTKLNRHGVPIIPLILSVALPCVVLSLAHDFEVLAGLYAIGVVGAISVNLGSCTFNKNLDLAKWERVLFGCTFAVLSAVELTLAHEKHEALFFVVCVLGIGLSLRVYAQKRSGLTTITVTHEVAQIVAPEAIDRLRPTVTEGQRIMVSARGITPVLRFALDEARLRKATLCVLYVKELAVHLPEGGRGGGGRARWQDDPQASAIMSLMLKLGQEVGVDVLPVYAVSTNPAGTILDLAATLGVDFLMLGASHRLSMSRLLKGNVVEEVARGLPEDIQLIIHS